MQPSLLHRMLREYSRRELPAWGRLLTAFGVNGARFDERWQSAPTLTVRGKLHHYLMELDLRNWSDRHAYFLERYYDLATQLLLMHALQPGDRVVDVGANTGMLTLLMARLVGPGGIVEAIEPNPVCAARLERAVQLNQLSQVRLHVCALGDAQGEAVLRQTSAHTGTSTLGVPATTTDAPFREFTVRVVTGDAIVGGDARTVTLIKMDVEGYELPALRGLQKTIACDHPILLTEVDARWLARCQTTPGDIEGFLRARDYAPFSLATPRSGMGRELTLEPVVSLRSDSRADILWVHHQSHDRLGPLLKS